MKQLVFIYIILTGFVFFLGQVARVELSPGLAVNALDVLVGIAAFVFALRIFKKKISWTTSSKLLLIFTAISLLALCIHIPEYGANSIFISSLYLVRLLCYWSIFYLLRLYPDLQDPVRKVMLGSGVAVVAIGFVQYIYYPNLRNLFYLGWDEHLFRLFSTFLDPNFAGAFFALFFFLVILFLAKARVQRVKIIYSILSIAVLIALYLTYSRTAIIMLIVGVITFFSVYGKRKYMLLAIVILVFGFLAFANRGIEGLNPFRIASSKARIETMGNSLVIFSQNPAIGIGFNAYRYEQIRQGFRFGEFSLTSHADAGVDNSLLFLLATTGVIGIVLYSLFLRKIITESVKGVGRIEKATLASLGTAFLAGGLFTNLLFFPPLLLFVICFLATTRSKQP